VERFPRVGLAMEGYMMLQMKHSSKDNSSRHEKKAKKRKCQDKGDQREDKPKDYGSGRKSGCKKSRNEDKTKGQTPVHMEMKNVLEGIAPSLVEAQVGRANVLVEVWITMHGHSAINLLCPHPLKAKGQKHDHPKGFSSMAGAAGSKSKVQVSAST